jgi:hypothetical protein
MSSHNELTFRASRWMLDQLRAGTPAWSVADITPAVTLGSWFEAWPRPDETFYDANTDRSLAVEFKPPGHGKREYVTGLGQCLTYLNAFDYALLVTPFESLDGFAIANYLGETIRSKPLEAAPLGILAYTADPQADMQMVEALRPRSDKVDAAAKQRSTFWGYWRDLSQYDVLDLLAFIDSQGGFDNAYQRFWDQQLSVGKARLWDGKFRKPWKPTLFGPNKINTNLSLRHASLISSDGLLTQEGLHLLQLGKVYGADSLAFRDTLARHVLLDSRHLELIYWIYEVQRSLDAKHETSSEHLAALDQRLIDEGVINPPAGHAKPTYIRDEPKLWNALGLLQRRTKASYFWPEVGLIFNWRRITAVVAAG